MFNFILTCCDKLLVGIFCCPPTPAQSLESRAFQCIHGTTVIVLIFSLSNDMIISIFSVESKRIELIFSVLIKGYLLTGFFSRYSTHGNPFDYVYVEDEAEDVLAENGVSPVI